MLEAAENSLPWSPNASARLIVIAGNESFDQGNPSGSTIAARLPNHEEIDGVTGQSVPAPISLHTIFCGPDPEGKRDNWESAAEKGKGTYTVIDITALR